MAWRRERVSLKIWVCGVGDEILDDLKLAGCGVGSVFHRFLHCFFKKKIREREKRESRTVEEADKGGKERD